jgi:putative flippase GtrA
MLKSLYSKWCKIDDKIRFLLVGGVNFAISYVIYAISIYLLGQEYYQLCLILQWVLSSFTSYFNQKFFVFCTKGNYVKEYLKCCSTWVLSYFLNALLLEVFVKYVFKNVFISQFIAAFLVSVATYVLFKYFAFKPKN